MASSIWIGLWMVGLSSLGVVILGMRATDQRRRDAGRERFRVRFPTGLSADVVIAFVSALGGLPRTWQPHRGESTVVLEVVAEPHEVAHYLRIPDGQSHYVIAQLRALIPGVRISPDGTELPAVGEAVELRLTDQGRELRVDNPVAVTASLLASTQPLSTGERVVMQWVIAPAVKGPIKNDGRGVAQRWLEGAKGTKPDPEVVKAAKRKAEAPLFRVVGRVGVAARNFIRARHLLWRVTGTLHSLRQPGVTLKRRLLLGRHVASRMAEARTPWFAYPSRLNARELAALIAWPLADPQIAGVSVGGSRELIPDPAIPSQGRIVGEATFPGAERPLALPEREALHHLHVIGPTGVGKSTLLAGLILQDIAESRGVVVIDPKGDLVADVLDRIPPSHADRVVVLDPTDDERPVGLNLLHGADEAPEVVTDQVVAIFHQMYESYWGPRTQDVLHAGLLTLAAEPGLTLCELPTLLVNDAFRRRLVAKIDDAIALGPFWSWFAQLKPGERAQALGPVMNKLRPLLLRRRVRNVIGQSEPTFTLDQVLSEPKVLLVSLAKGLLGPEAAALIGSLVVAQLWQAIQRRAAIAPANRKPAFVFMDEFQSYLSLPTDLSDVLTQARGLGVGVVAAHQHVGQLTPAIRQAVFANARSRVAFQSGADDAALLAKQLGGGLSGSDLQDLGAFQVYASLYAQGRVRAPASARTYPMPEPLGTSDAIRRASRSRYGRAREDVEAGIVARQGLRADAGPVGRTGRPT